MQKQVDKSHYEFNKYVHKRRWASMWHQLDEVIKLNPGRVLEVGHGPGLLKATASVFGVHVETLDLDPDLKPDHLASVFEMPFENEAFDVVCAFQMLEHLPYDRSLVAFSEMVRVAKTAVIISLPDAATGWPVSVHVPKIGAVQFLIPRPFQKAKKHEFNGEHYWEINKLGYSLREITKALLSNQRIRLSKTYRVHEYPWHRFFVFNKSEVIG